MKYIITDPISWATAGYAIGDMGNKKYVSALLVDGPPGCGKTYLAEMLAYKLRAEFRLFQCFLGCGEHHFLYGLPDADGRRGKGFLPQCAELSHTKKVVAFIDELDKGGPEVDPFFYEFLGNGRVWVPPNEEIFVNKANLLFVFAKNDVRPAASPLMRRCRCSIMKWPKPETETAILVDNFPYIDAEAFSVLIRYANDFRYDRRLIKPPSTPELVRLTQDTLNNISSRLDGSFIGEYAFCALLNRLEDQTLTRASVNPDSLGVQLKEAFNPYLTQFQSTREACEVFANGSN